MRSVAFVFILFFGIAACNSEKKEPEVTPINPNDIKPGPIIHDSLSDEQLKKVELIQKTFAEVYPISFEETVTNFKRDQDPDKEIGVWMNMVATYNDFISRDPNIDAAKKHEVFRLILIRSMMPDKEAISEAQVTLLSEQEIDAILKYYGSLSVIKGTQD